MLMRVDGRRFCVTYYDFTFQFASLTHVLMAEHVKSTMTILKVTVAFALRNTQDSIVKVRTIAARNTSRQFTIMNLKYQASRMSAL